MLKPKTAAPVLAHRNGQKMRGFDAPCTTIVHHRPAEYKTRLAGTSTAALAVLACICLAEFLAGSGWGYLPAALAATLAANAFAGVALGSRKEARYG